MKQERAPAFFEWFLRFGGVNCEVLKYEIERRLADDPPPEHSFKERAEEIKKLYNHTFKANTHESSEDNNI